MPGVIVVTRLAKSTRTAMQQLRRQLENLKAPTRGVVVNGAKSETGYGYGYGHSPPAATNGASASPYDHEPESIQSRPDALILPAARQSER